MRNVVVVLALWIGWVSSAFAQKTAETATAREALIALRVLAYDRTLAKRAPGEHVTVLVVASSTKTGRASLELWQRAFALFPNVKASGRRVLIRAHEYVDERTLDAAVAQARPALLIALDTPDVPAISRVTRKRQVLSCALGEAAVAAGLGYGIVRTDDASEIVINVAAARAEGARFNAALLDLARLVGGEP